VHNPVGVSGNTGRVDFEESCEVVDYQLKSGLEVRHSHLLFWRWKSGLPCADNLLGIPLALLCLTIATRLKSGTRTTTDL